MWESSFLAVLWVLWKERNSHCFDGQSSSMDRLEDMVKFLVASWVHNLPAFKGIPIDSIMRGWYMVANSYTPPDVICIVWGPGAFCFLLRVVGLCLGLFRFLYFGCWCW